MRIFCCGKVGENPWNKPGISVGKRDGRTTVRTVACFPPLPTFLQRFSAGIFHRNPALSTDFFLHSADFPHPVDKSGQRMRTCGIYKGNPDTRSLWRTVGIKRSRMWKTKWPNPEKKKFPPFPPQIIFIIDFSISFIKKNKTPII